MKTVYIIKAFDIIVYCKHTIILLGDKTYHTVSFGGKKDFCITVCIKPDKPLEPYIDRVEYNEKCVKDGKLEMSSGTRKLFRIALWTMKRLFPTIKKLTFIDDSHIYCEKGSRRYKLNLAYDYILKTGNTWYEHTFKAQLLGENMAAYKESLKVLDETLYPFALITELLPLIVEYKSEYEESKSPRDFIERLRKTYKDQYCYKVGGWLSAYMQFLQIKIFKEMWYIHIDDIDIPDKYSIEETNDILSGGSRTRRSQKKNFRLASSTGNISHIGYGTEI